MLHVIAFGHSIMFCMTNYALWDKGPEMARTRFCSFLEVVFFGKGSLVMRIEEITHGWSGMRVPFTVSCVFLSVNLPTAYFVRKTLIIKCFFTNACALLFHVPSFL